MCIYMYNVFPFAAVPGNVVVWKVVVVLINCTMPARLLLTTVHSGIAVNVV